MADQFVLTSTRKWRDPWYRKLPKHIQRAFDYLTQPPGENKEGILEALVEDMAHDAMLTIDEFNEALDRLEADGRIQREGDYILVIKWFRHQARPKSQYPNQADKRFTRAWQGLIDKVSKCPKLVKRWLLEYAPDKIPEIFPDDQKSGLTQTITGPEALHKPLGSPSQALGKQKSKSKSKRRSKKREPSMDSGESSRSRSSKFKSDIDYEAELADLEKKLKPHIADEWDQFKHMVANQNKTKTVSHRRLLTLLKEIIEQIQEYNLTTPQVIHGFRESIKEGAANKTYFRKAAYSYREGVVKQQPQPPRLPKTVILTPPGASDD
jgi:hypothetical protein